MSLLAVLAFSGLAGAAIPLGASLAFLEGERLTAEHHNLHGAILAFGGGIFVGAITFVLVPEGTHRLSTWGSATAFALGTAAIMAVDHAIQLWAGDLGRALAMLTDFVPEAIAFGALFATGSSGPFFAVLIAMQNLPEAYTSFYDLVEGGVDDGRALAVLAPLALLGPAAAVGGFLFLGDDPRVIGSLTLLAAGGILYLVFQRIAPPAFQEGNWLATAAVAVGFLVGLVGHGLTA